MLRSNHASGASRWEVWRRELLLDRRLTPTNLVGRIGIVTVRLKPDTPYWDLRLLTETDDC